MKADKCEICGSATTGKLCGFCGAAYRKGERKGYEKGKAEAAKARNERKVKR